MVIVIGGCFDDYWIVYICCDFFCGFNVRYVIVGFWNNWNIKCFGGVFGGDFVIYLVDVFC